MDAEQRRRVGEYVKAQRMHKFKTVDRARIVAQISRGAWDAVEQGKKVRDFTYGAIEAALDLSPGFLARLGQSEELAEGLVAGEEMYTELVEWVQDLRPNTGFDPAPTSALAYWTTEQMLEVIAERERGHRENVRWHVDRYNRLKAQFDALKARTEPEGTEAGGESEERLTEFFREQQPQGSASKDENPGERGASA